MYMYTCRYNTALFVRRVEVVRGKSDHWQLSCDGGGGGGGMEGEGREGGKG